MYYHVIEVKKQNVNIGKKHNKNKFSQLSRFLCSTKNDLVES